MWSFPQIITDLLVKTKRVKMTRNSRAVKGFDGLDLAHMHILVHRMAWSMRTVILWESSSTEGTQSGETLLLVL